MGVSEYESDQVLLAVAQHEPVSERLLGEIPGPLVGDAEDSQRTGLGRHYSELDFPAGFR